MAKLTLESLVGSTPLCEEVKLPAVVTGWPTDVEVPAFDEPCTVEVEPNIECCFEEADAEVTAGGGIVCVDVEVRPLEELMEIGKEDAISL